MNEHSGVAKQIKFTRWTLFANAFWKSSSKLRTVVLEVRKFRKFKLAFRYKPEYANPGKRNMKLAKMGMPISRWKSIRNVFKWTACLELLSWKCPRFSHLTRLHKKPHYDNDPSDVPSDSSSHSTESEELWVSKFKHFKLRRHSRPLNYTIWSHSKFICQIARKFLLDSIRFHKISLDDLGLSNARLRKRRASFRSLDFKLSSKDRLRNFVETRKGQFGRVESLVNLKRLKLEKFGVCESFGVWISTVDPKLHTLDVGQRGNTRWWKHCQVINMTLTWF